MPRKYTGKNVKVTVGNDTRATLTRREALEAAGDLSYPALALEWVQRGQALATARAEVVAPTFGRNHLAAQLAEFQATLEEERRARAEVREKDEKELITLRRALRDETERADRLKADRDFMQETLKLRNFDLDAARHELTAARDHAAKEAARADNAEDRLGQIQAQGCDDCGGYEEGFKAGQEQAALDGLGSAVIRLSPVRNVDRDQLIQVIGAAIATEIGQ